MGMHINDGYFEDVQFLSLWALLNITDLPLREVLPAEGRRGNLTMDFETREVYPIFATGIVNSLTYAPRQ
jgi:hypothetical protein